MDLNALVVYMCLTCCYISAENVGDVVGELNNIFSAGTSAQDQSEDNLGIVQNVFSGAAELAVSGNFSVSKDVSYTPMSWVLFLVESDLDNIVDSHDAAVVSCCLGYVCLYRSL